MEPESDCICVWDDITSHLLAISRGAGKNRNMRIFTSFAIMLGLAIIAPSQVKTEVPPVVAGAKPVTVEHIVIHGAALEGNLEGDDVDRAAIVFLPPGYSTERNRRYPVVYAL